MVCAMQELNTTAVAITDSTPQHSQLLQHNQHHHLLQQQQQQQHLTQTTTSNYPTMQQQQQLPQQVEIVRALASPFTNSNGTSSGITNPPQMTTIVVLTTPGPLIQGQASQQTVINLQQQPHLHLTQTPTPVQQQQHHQSHQQHKSQQLKKQHASLVRLLESAPITQKTKGNDSLKINKMQQQTSLQQQQQQQQQIVIPQLQQTQQQQIIYVQHQTTATTPHQQTTPQTHVAPFQTTLSLTQQQPQLAQQLLQPKRLKTNSSSSLSTSSSSLSLAGTSLTLATPLIQAPSINSKNVSTKPQQQQHQQQVLPPATLSLSNLNPLAINPPSDKSNLIKTLNHSNNNNNINSSNLISTILMNTTTTNDKNQEYQKPQEEPTKHQMQPQLQHQTHTNPRNDSESGIEEELENDLKLETKTTATTTPTSNKDLAYEPQQCPWKKIRYARELKQKEQMEKNQEIKDEVIKTKCDNDIKTIKNNLTTINAPPSNCPYSPNFNELNLAEQTHKEIAILLQKQHQNYQQLQQQQQQQHRRDSSDSNSSLISNTSSNHSLSNGCTCTPQQLQSQRDSSDDDLYLEDISPQRRLASRRASLLQDQEMEEISINCQCADCHLENMDDSGCDDGDQKEEEQSTLNYLCQKFDENLETQKQIQNTTTTITTNTTDLEKVAIVKRENEEDQGKEETGKHQKDDGFFRRSIQQKIQYRPCTKNQQCSILRINRNRCQYCRLKKCIAVGMSRDAVRFGRVPKREKARILAAMQQSTQNRGQQRALSGELDDQPRLLSAVLRAHLETCEFTKEKVAAMRQRARECPSYSMPTLLACPLNPAPELQSEQEFSQRFAHVIRGVIDFAGMIPGFQLLSQDDKFTLLKAGLFDALFVRLICMFDNSINSIICLNGQVMRRDAIQNGANARFLVDSTFNFAERMNSMNLTDAEIGLFCAIVLITPDRPGLRNIELIEKMYSRLKGCLQTIINQNRPDQPEFMSKLLETMPDLRTLSTLHTEKLVVFRTEHKELLRQQMWSMEDDQPSLSKSPNSWEDHRMDVEAKSPLGSVSSTESNDLDYPANSTTSINSSLTQQINHHPPSSLASSAPLLAATLSGSCPLRNRANSGSSGDSNNELDMVVGSHAHLTQNGLTITPIVRSNSHHQLQHHLSSTTHRYRKLDSPTDSGIESGNEKTECSKNVSSGGSSSCSSPRSSVDDALDCQDQQANSSQVTVSVSPVRSPQPLTQQASSTSNSNLKRQIVDDMPVLKRVLQAPPLYDTNSLMDEAYKPHKKFRALRHREFDCTEADASSSTNTPNSSIPASNSSPLHQSSNNQSPPPTAAASSTSSNMSQQQHQQQQQQQVLMVPQAAHSPSAPLASSPPAIAQHQSQLHMHLTRPTPTNSNSGAQHQQQTSSLSSTHSVLAKSLMAEPRMTPEQMKRSDIIQNYIMRDTQQTVNSSNSLMVCSPLNNGSRSPAPLQHQMHLNNLYNQGSNSPNSSTSPNSPSTTCSNNSASANNLISTPSNSPANQRWPGHSVITTTTINQRQQSVSPSSNGSSSSSTSSTSSSSSASTASSSTSNSSNNSTGCQYFQSPHSTSNSVSPPRPSPSQMSSSPRLLELQVDIADSQQPLNLSKKSPTPPPSKLQALVAAASAAQRYPTVSADVTVTATSSTVSSKSSSAANSSSLQQQQQKVMLEA